MFVELVGVTKAQGSVEYPMLEYCIREDLKLKVKRMMAVLDPVKLVIDNYPEGQVEYMEVANNQENPEKMCIRDSLENSVNESRSSYDDN